tara:strand:- start:1873 stop:2277 length:405 start_codon:yes stop_codon:yes gene_type:complete
MDITSYTKNTDVGRKILSSNPFFKDLVTIMKNTEFKNFYDTYFRDWSDIQTMIFYMKIYKTTEFEYTRRHNSTISDELMVYTLHGIMTTTETRKVAMQLFTDFKELNHDRSYDFRTLIQFNNPNNNMKKIKESI